jgi:hypothetical protein
VCVCVCVYVYVCVRVRSLVITPETVAFDRDGNVCFLDLDAGESLLVNCT